MPLLDSLPPSNDEYWEGSEVETLKPKIKQCEHSFRMTEKARDVECVNCHVGFTLGGNSTLKDTHIYIDDKFVI